MKAGLLLTVCFLTALLPLVKTGDKLFALGLPFLAKADLNQDGEKTVFMLQSYRYYSRVSPTEGSGTNLYLIFTYFNNS